MGGRTDTVTDRCSCDFDFVQQMFSLFDQLLLANTDYVRRDMRPVRGSGLFFFDRRRVILVFRILFPDWAKRTIGNLIDTPQYQCQYIIHQRDQASKLSARYALDDGRRCP